MSDIIVLDCDSMIYLACYKEPSFARRKAKLMEDVKKVQTSLGGDEIYPLLKGKNNFRYSVASTYKGNRKDDKLTDEARQLKEWVNELTEWAGESLGMACHDAEADDYVGILNKRFTEEGHTVIMSHIDKDLNQLMGHHHNFNKNEVYTIEPELGYHWLYKQTLMGDAADNIIGLHKVGIKTAEKMLSERAPSGWWDLLCKAYQAEHKDEWEERLRVCANLVFMRTREEDLINLSFNQIKDIYLWENQTLVIGLSAPTQETYQQTSSDSSTKSSIEILEDDTSERNNSTAIPSNESLEKSEEPKSLKNPSGESTPVAVSRSTKKSNRKAKTTSSS